MDGDKATIAGLGAGPVAIAAYASGNNAATGAEARQQLLFVQIAASGSLVATIAGNTFPRWTPCLRR